MNPGIVGEKGKSAFVADSRVMPHWDHGPSPAPCDAGIHAGKPSV